jgi:acyl-CoA thioesterase FadM
MAGVEPFVEYRTVVREEWLDYNGHMNDAYYALVCCEASEVFLDALGLGAAYQAATGCTTYTVESHLRYLKEAVLGEPLRAETLLVAADAKRFRVRHSLLNGVGLEIALGEYVYVHVNQRSGRVEPMPADRQAVLDSKLALCGPHVRPAGRGRRHDRPGDDATVRADRGTNDDLDHDA